jgi:glycosyltransferase involved in cell wall biosynthesis
MPKVILLSQHPLPFSRIGSWTTLYKNYLQGEYQIDFIVCEPPEKQFERVQYSLVANDFIFRVRRKITGNWYLGYLEALEKILSPNEKYVIQIIDNFGIVKPLHELLHSKGLRSNCYLQFFYHGFSPFYENRNESSFFESIDEMVLLTHDSYLVHKNYYSVLPIRFSVLHNGIDTKKFFPLLQNEKQAIKQSKNVADKKVFVWCSQDRPKKGLSILLEAWKQVYKTRQDIILWIIGCEPKTPQNGIVYLGRIPNDELAVYFQVSDCYLFPTLCQEGFGMSLIEALHCGNYCIASALGGVPEVLQYGKLGKLIENPHFVEDWINGILGFIENPEPKLAIPADLYASESWKVGMNSLINNAKKTVSI